MARCTESAAGGTSHRLKPGCATVCSRSRKRNIPPPERFPAGQQTFQPVPEKKRVETYISLATLGARPTLTIQEVRHGRRPGMSAIMAAIPIQRINGMGRLDSEDELAIEEPLEIRLDHRGPEGPEHQSLCLTMRTPGQDDELAVGFLLSEGLIRNRGDLREARPHRPGTARPGRPNVVRVFLQDHVTVDLTRLERHFYTTSSCGVCGKASIEALRTQSPYPPLPEGSPPLVSASLLQGLPDRLRAAQEGFKATGGEHASALFDAAGKLLLLREDVGRHNALDKVLGRALMDDLLPLRD